MYFLGEKQTKEELQFLGWGRWRCSIVIVSKQVRNQEHTVFCCSRLDENASRSDDYTIYHFMLGIECTHTHTHTYTHMDMCIHTTLPHICIYTCIHAYIFTYTHEHGFRSQKNLAERSSFPVPSLWVFGWDTGNEAGMARTPCITATWLWIFYLNSQISHNHTATFYSALLQSKRLSGNSGWPILHYNAWG